MTLFMPFDRRQLPHDLLGLLIVDPYAIVLPSCAESMAGGNVIHRHDVISFLVRVVDLFACLCCELIEVAVGICDEDDCCGIAVIFIDGSPSQRIDRAWLLPTRLNLRNLIVSPQVKNPDTSITVSTGSHSILMIESSNHQLSGLRYHSLHQDLILQRNLLHYSK